MKKTVYKLESVEISEGRKQPGRLLLALIVLALVLTSVPSESAMRYYGSLSVQEEENGRLLQQSIQRFSADSTQTLTNKLTSEESLLYSSEWVQGYGTKDGSSRDTLSPSLGVNIQNELFMLQLTGSSIKVISQSNLSLPDTNTVELNWLSRWQKSNVPDIDFTLTYTDSENDSDNINQDIESLDGNSSFDWNFGPANLYYSYAHELTTDKVNNIKTESSNQLARFSAAKSFFNRRLNVNFNQSYTEGNVKRRISFGGSAPVQVTQAITDVYTGVDIFPSDNNDTPPGGTLVSSPAMDDDDTTTLAGFTVAGASNDHTVVVGLGGTINDRVNTLYLYTEDSLGSTFSGFELYTTGAINTPWVNETSSIASSTYNSVDRRYEIVLTAPLQANFLKIHFDNTGPADIEVTEIDALLFLSQAAGTQSTTEAKSKKSITRFGVAYNVNKHVSTSYSYAIQQNDFGVKNITTTHAGALRYNSLSGTTSTIDFSDRTSEKDGSDDSLIRTYGLDIKKSFLPTLHGSIGGSRNETYQAGMKTNESDRINASLDAQLYPDLSSKLDGSYTTLVQNATGDDSEVWQAGLSITSRIKPTVNMTFSEKYLESINVLTETTTYNSTLFWVWQPSDVFSYNGSLTHEDVSDREEIISMNTTSAMKVGYKMQFEVNHSISRQTSVSQSGSITLRWNVGRRLALRSGINYSQSEGVPENHVKFFTELSFRDSIY